MRTTSQNTGKIKTTILDTAEFLFFENGVSCTSLEMIARECGVTRGAMYWHFGDKAQIIIEMVDRIIVPLRVTLRKLEIDSDRDCLEKLLDLCVEWMEKVAQPSKERLVMTILLRRCTLIQELHRVKENNARLSQEFISMTENIFNSQLDRLQEGLTPRIASVYLQKFLYGMLTTLIRPDEELESLLEIPAMLTIYFRILVKKQYK